MTSFRTPTTLLAAVCLMGTTGCMSFSNQLAYSTDQPPVFNSQVPMGKIFERQGELGKAKEVYLAVLQQDPGDVKALHRLGIVAARSGNYDQSDSYFEQAYSLAPDDPVLLCDFGYALSLQRRLEEAEFLLEKSVALNPSYTQARNNLALVVGLQGRFNESFAMFRQVGSAAQAHANLGFVHVQRGDFDLAIAHYNQALTLDSDLRPAAEALIQLTQFQQKQPPAHNLVASTTSNLRQADGWTAAGKTGVVH